MRRIQLVRLQEQGEVGAYMALSLSGGVGTAWLAERLSTFNQAIRYAQSALRKPKLRVKRPGRVH
jgi:hypothetical protein